MEEMKTQRGDTFYLYHPTEMIKSLDERSVIKNYVLK